MAGSITTVLSDGSERVPYNENAYPIYSGSGWLHSLPDMSFSYHWHDDWEFEYALKGHMTYSVNGEVFTIREGEGVFINSRQMHRNYSADGTDCLYACALFHPSVLRGKFAAVDRAVEVLAQNNAFAYHILHKDVPWEKDVLDQVGRAYRLILSGCDPHMVGILASLFRAVEILLENEPQPKEAVTIDRRIPALRAMVGYIQAHYMEKIALEDICRAGMVGTGTCYDIFKKNIHQTPMTYLMSYRLEKAIDLLNNPGLTVTDVAYATGFTGASYFTESFRKQYGMTPTEYRKSKQKGPIV